MTQDYGISRAPDLWVCLLRWTGSVSRASSLSSLTQAGRQRCKYNSSLVSGGCGTWNLNVQLLLYAAVNSGEFPSLPRSAPGASRSPWPPRQWLQNFFQTLAIGTDVWFQLVAYSRYSRCPRLVEFFTDWGRYHPQGHNVSLFLFVIIPCVSGVKGHANGSSLRILAPGEWNFSSCGKRRLKWFLLPLAELHVEISLTCESLFWAEERDVSGGY